MGWFFDDDEPQGCDHNVEDCGEYERICSKCGMTWSFDRDDASRVRITEPKQSSSWFW